ncbi:MAG TPA: TetR/AcrR family transcriptional regulator [Myxococcota bacterium]|nr:TetR/AcrR family transcriptional regulator [Myxococcota bacterium]
MPRATDTRLKILEVAETEFATEGFAGAHLQKIAEQVGVRKTALYYYFESKSALYTAVLAEILEEFDRTVATAVEADETPERRLLRVIANVNDLLAERRNYGPILVRVFVDRSPIEAAELIPIVERVVGRVMRFYSEGRDAGAFRRISSRHVFMSVLGMTVLHYAAPGFSARILGVDDVFTRPAVTWRRDEVTALLARGVLARDPDPDLS